MLGYDRVYFAGRGRDRCTSTALARVDVSHTPRLTSLVPSIYAWWAYHAYFFDGHVRLRSRGFPRVSCPVGARFVFVRQGCHFPVPSVWSLRVYRCVGWSVGARRPKFVFGSRP